MTGLECLLSSEQPDVHAHSLRVAALAASLAQRMGVPEDRIDRLMTAARLHDIGKLRLTRRILDKPGRPTRNEWRELERHPELGFRMIVDHVHAEIALTVRSHHERFDGSGYPHGLAGEEIPLLARILTVADALDAMTSNRCYKPPRSVDEAFAELLLYRRRQFDPMVVEVAVAAAPHLEFTRVCGRVERTAAAT